MTELNWCKILARVFTGNNYLVIDSLRFLMLGIYGWTLRQQSSSYCAHLGREVYLQSCIFHFLKCTVQWMWTSFLYCSHWLKLLDRHCNKDVGDTMSPITQCSSEIMGRRKMDYISLTARYCSFTFVVCRHCLLDWRFHPSADLPGQVKQFILTTKG